MKVELTQRDIELLLILLNENAVGDLGDLKNQPSFSIEELALIDKLEAAIRQNELLDKILFDVSKSDNTYH